MKPKESDRCPFSVCRWGQSCALVGDQVFMFGGYGAGGEFCKDLYVLNTGKSQAEAFSS